MKYSIPTKDRYPKPVFLAFAFMATAEEIFPSLPEPVTFSPGGLTKEISQRGLKLAAPEAELVFDRLVPKLRYELFPKDTTPSATLQRLMNLKEAAVDESVRSLCEATTSGFHEWFGEDAATHAQTQVERLMDAWRALQASVAPLTLSHHLLQEHIEHFVMLYEPETVKLTGADELQALSDRYITVRATLRELVDQRNAYFETGSASSFVAYYEESERLRETNSVRPKILQELPEREDQIRQRFAALDDKLVVCSLDPELLA